AWLGLAWLGLAWLGLGLGLGLGRLDRDLQSRPDERCNAHRCDHKNYSARISCDCFVDDNFQHADIYYLSMTA
ncbi:MAG: hypothetical protein OSB20_07945, partial [Porticoccaceae bacterium]|nr:hypothetical protein [Porticoccaceae bacterium]